MKGSRSKRLRVPAFMHDLLGTGPTRGTLLAMLVCGALCTAALGVRFPEFGEGRPVWGSVISMLLVWDIVTGCMANFTRSTSGYYANHPRKRIIFLAVHLHIVLIAVLLHADLGPALCVWVMSILGGAVVSGLTGRPSQHFAAGVLLTLGLGFVTLLPFDSPFMMTVGLLFLLKVLYSFAVDHYGHAGRGAGEGE